MVTRLNLSERRFEGPLAQWLTVAEPTTGVMLYWLGQALSWRWQLAGALNAA
jgi:hypothetical protein